MSTPQGHRCSRRGRATPSPARSDVTASDMSLAGVTPSDMSMASRMSRLSQRSQRQLTSEEIELAQADAKRREVQALMRLNEKTYKDAIRCPDVHHRHHSLSATVPEEFELSTRGSSRSKSAFRGPAEGSSEASPWERSLRSGAAAEWRPQLTVPEGPALHTAGRSRSLSSVRSERGAPGRSMSRGRTPREDVALREHLRRAETAQEERAQCTARERTRALRPAPEAELPRGPAESRAERARATAVAQQDAIASARQRLCVF